MREIRLLLATALAVFLGEGAIMFCLDRFAPGLDPVLAGVLDASILTVVVFLTVHLLFVRRLARRSERLRAARDAVADRERLLGSIFASAAEGIVYVDTDGKVVTANPAAERMVGYSIHDLAGRSLHETLDHRGPSGAPLPEEACPLMSSLRDGLVRCAAGHQITCRDGSRRVVDLCWGPVRSEEGVLGAIVTLLDVTERRSAEVKAAQSYRLATLGTLAASVGHEINNPLTYILVNIEATREAVERYRASDPDRIAEIQSDLDEAARGVNRVAEIVRDLKGLARTSTPGNGPVDVNRAVRSALRVAANQIRHRGRIVEDFGEIPPVIANEGRLIQVFLNLLVNAGQALPEDRYEENEVRIRTRAAEGEVRVEISDTGCGIPAPILERIFEPFFTTKPSGIGTGLGLSISREIVGEIGGRIEARCEEGGGTTFAVSIPLSEAGSAAAAMAATDAASFSSPRRRLLVVDDEEAVRRAVGRALERDHDVTTVESAAEALRVIEGTPRKWDLVLSDLMMPERSGMWFHEQLRARAPDLARGMIFLTGGTFTPEARGFLERVPNRRIEKPFTTRTLRREVAAALAG